MRKRQLLKLGNGKKGKAIGGAVLSLAMATMIGGGVLAAGNIQDSYYSLYGENEYWYATPTRDKIDATSSYILHQKESGVYVQVRSKGINYTANGASYYVGVGSSRYLPNYVKENGQSTCYLLLNPSVSGRKVDIVGKWSPDSI